MKEARGGGQESNRGRGCVVAWDGGVVVSQGLKQADGAKNFVAPEYSLILFSFFLVVGD